MCNWMWKLYLLLFSGGLRVRNRRLVQIEFYGVNLTVPEQFEHSPEPIAVLNAGQTFLDYMPFFLARESFYMIWIVTTFYNMSANIYFRISNREWPDEAHILGNVDQRSIRDYYEYKVMYLPIYNFTEKFWRVQIKEYILAKGGKLSGIERQVIR